MRCLNGTDEGVWQGMKKINKEQAIDIAQRYLSCNKKIKNCFKDCSKCKYDYTDLEIKKMAQFVIDLGSDAE